MKQTVKLTWVLSFFVGIIFASHIGAMTPMLDPQISMMQSNESLNQDCYDLINQNKFKEAFDKASSIENILDKIDIYLEIGTKTDRANIKNKVNSELDKLANKDIDFISKKQIEEKVTQYKFKSMTVQQQNEQLQSQTDLAEISMLLSIDSSSLNVSVGDKLYKKFLTLLKENKTLENFKYIITILDLGKSNVFVSQRDTMYDFIFNEAKAMEIFFQIDILEALLNSDDKNNTIYTDYLKNLYQDSELSDKLIITTQLCTLDNVLSENDFTTLEKATLDLYETDKSTHNNLNWLIQYAECKDNTIKKEMYIELLPEFQKQQYSVEN